MITGIGIVCPLGSSWQELGDNLFAGRTCIAPLEGVEISDPRYYLGGQIKDFDIQAEMPTVDARRIFRYSQFALLAAHRSLQDACLDVDACNRDRVGTSFGTAAAGMGEAVEQDARSYISRGARGISPVLWAEYTPCACTTHVAIHYGLRGPSSTHSSGCVTGSDAIMWGVTQLKARKAEVMVVGGADALFTSFLWAALHRSGILAPAPEDGGGIPRPFSHDHNGIALVEGGSALVLETESHARLRGARVHGEIVGIASCEEARSITDLDETGAAFAMTMQAALDDAGIPPREIDWVCAHGTGFPAGDRAESRGTETALGEHAFCVPVSSIRGAVGQSFASGGAIQVAAACLAIRRQAVPPTLNFTAPAPGCRLDYVPNAARVARVRRVLINSAGVGGTHSCIIVSAYQG